MQIFFIFTFLIELIGYNCRNCSKWYFFTFFSVKSSFLRKICKIAKITKKNGKFWHFFLDLSNSVNFYHLLEFEMHIGVRIYYFWKKEKFFQFLVSLNQKWDFWKSHMKITAYFHIFSTKFSYVFFKKCHFWFK